MAASPPGSCGRFRAATCRRWGDVGALISVARSEARRHYFARVARRAMRTRRPAPAICSGSVALAAVASARSVSPAPTRACSASRARSPACAAPRSGPAHMLAVCPSMIAREEAKAAPRLYDNFTDGGTVCASEFVTRLPWSSPDRAQEAAVTARCLDIADVDRLRDRSPSAWSSLVCSLAAVYLKEFQPAFARASREALARGVSLPAVPMRGRFGWRARARFAGLLDVALSYDDADEFEDVD